MFNPGFILEITKHDYKERYAGSILGLTWAFISPLVPLFIYLIIFGQFMGARLPGRSDMSAYGIYLCAGLVPWTTFANTITRSTTVFLDKKNIIGKIPVSLPSLFLFVNLSEVVTWCIMMGFFFIYLLFVDFTFTSQLLMLPLILYLQQLFAMSLGLIFATLTVFLRDIKDVVGIVVQFWFWFTPLVYVLDIVPDFVQRLMVFNPAFIFADAYHQIFVYHQALPTTGLVVLAIITHLLLAAGYALFSSLQKDIRDAL